MSRHARRIYPLFFAAIAMHLYSSGCRELSEFPPKPCVAAGGEGCDCGASGRCDLLADGTRMVCREGRCTRPTCEGQTAPAVGCLCGGAAPCEEGLVCHNGTCQADSGQTLTPPAEPKCYTPCRGGGYVDDDGVYHACSADGLVPGCVDRATCVDGTCVAPVESSDIQASCDDDVCDAPCQLDVECGAGYICDGGYCRPKPSGSNGSDGSCDEDDDCAPHQSCIARRCYSDCEDSVDCRPGRHCYRMTCRVHCDGTGQPPCPEGTLCNTIDGQVGYCLPVGVDTTPSDDTDPHSGDNNPEDPAEIGPGSIAVEPEILPLNKGRDGGSFVVTNNTAQPRCFTVERFSHTEYGGASPSRITEFPLHWLGLETETEGAGSCGDTLSSGSLSFRLEAGGEARVDVVDAENEILQRWDGELRVHVPGFAPHRVALSYTGTAEGQWVGSAYYFGNFGTRGLDGWLNNRRDQGRLSTVGNALIRRWGALRSGQLSVAEFKAVLSQTLTESWRNPSVAAICPSAGAPNANAACYLFNNEPGISIYSDYLPDNPVPTAVHELPMAMNLGMSPGEGPGLWRGKIVSSKALHYAGDPEVELTFEGDPSQCPVGEGNCVQLLRSFSSSTMVGGRYVASARDTYCASAHAGTYEPTRVPWLVPGFLEGTETDGDGRRYRFECRDTMLPYGLAGRSNGLNASLAAANPVPDGRPRKRTLRLIDGALIDQENLIIFFKETFPSFMGSDDEDFATYGVMDLTLSPTRLDGSDYVGSVQTDDRLPVGLPALACDDETLEQIASGLSLLSASDRGLALVTGQMPSAVPPEMVSTEPFPLSSEDPQVVEVPADSERVHYWCEDTNVFDAGADGTVACPRGSKVTFFTLSGAGAAQAAVDGESCNLCPLPDRALCGCDRTLAAWVANDTHEVRLNPASRCIFPFFVSCSGDRFDLRSGKVFFKASATEAFANPIDDLVQEAFRYKTKFKGRDGAGVGFAPEVCSPIPGETPYCYDPDSIEALRTRIDCVIQAYVDPDERAQRTLDHNGDEANVVMRSFLERNFAYREEFRPDAGPLVHDGFERLYAELLVLMGDESVVGAFASRFDLADMRVATFEGDKFEPEGIVLPGGGGFEMYSLYQATQYYQLALDRFYRLSPAIWEAIGRLSPAEAFIGAATVSSYFNRLTYASTAKALAWGQVAERYQNRNRPDLARHVIERAYTAAHLEAAVLSRLMLRTVRLADGPERSSIVHDVESAQRRYTRAFADMRETYEGLTDEVTYFGFPNDYVPFPVLYRFDTNAFEKSLSRAYQRLELAKEKELRALADDRSFETNAAEFQSQLATISRDYDGRLGAICGTISANFGGGTNAIYPATLEFADLVPGNPPGNDPCGLVGNGELYAAQLRYEQARARFEAAQLSAEHLVADIEDANARTVEQCGRIADLAQVERRTRNTITTLNTVISSLNETFAAVQRQFDVVARAAETSKCLVIAGTAGGSDCPIAIVSAAATATQGTIMNAVSTTLAAAGIASRTVISNLETDLAVAHIETQCTAMEIDTKYQIRQFFRRADEIGMEIFAVSRDVELTLSEIRKLQNEAVRLAADQRETTELAVNIEAARNDPNIRIYRNNAVLEADRTYDEARREAFRATKVYEYFTSQSYGPLGSLLDVRMVSHGSYTLEAYLSELSEAFYQFQETYGAEDSRLEIISLRDDIFAIGHLDGNATGESVADRRARFQKQLQNPALLDAKGYRRIPFSLNLERLSPATRNHKVEYVEIEVLSNAQRAETISRIYLEQVGTSTVRGLDDELQFYVLPKRSAVVDVFFNNTRFFDPEVYRSDVLRDRPVVNSRWELVINTRDEAANEDLVLDQITDIRIHLHYTDFVAQ